MTEGNRFHAIYSETGFLFLFLWNLEISVISVP